jgi:hypothetical protein
MCCSVQKSADEKLANLGKIGCLSLSPPLIFGSSKEELLVWLGAASRWWSEIRL